MSASLAALHDLTAPPDVSRPGPHQDQTTGRVPDQASGKGRARFCVDWRVAVEGCEHCLAAFEGEAINRRELRPTAAGQGRMDENDVRRVSVPAEPAPLVVKKHFGAIAPGLSIKRSIPAPSATIRKAAIQAAIFDRCGPRASSPAKVPDILVRVASCAQSRIVCEQHFLSDLEAGQAFGMLIAERLMEQPAFQAQF